jgi:hypothetical protein
MATIPFLQGILRKLIPGRDAVVKSLDIKPHYIPVNIKSLAVSLHYLNDEDLNNFYTELNTYLNKFKSLNVVTPTIYNINGILVTPEEISTYLKGGPLKVVDRNGEVGGILFSNFSSAQNNLFSAFLNTKMLAYVNKKVYANSKRKIGFDVGHTYIKGDNKYSDIANTPLSLQIDNLQAVVDDLLTVGAGSKLFRQAAEGKVGGFKLTANPRAQLSSVQINLQDYYKEFISKHSYGQKIVVHLNKDIRGLLVNVSANIVLIQDREENQGEFARVESALSKEVSNILSRLHFSKSAEEEIADRTVDYILNSKIKLKNVKVSKTISVSNITSKIINTRGKVTSGTIKTSRLRSTSGAFQSVTGLQAILASRLQEVIRKNMAPPALTYQTGRFAESVKLNSVQFDNRQNAITAFLSYMKYPYATFEVGGRQGSIDKSPYALIDRSVREIAAQLTKSRMRTIVV